MRYFFILLLPVFFSVIGSFSRSGESEEGFYEQIVKVCETPEREEPIHWHKRW